MRNNVEKEIIELRECSYISRTWLNPIKPSATGSVICYDGIMGDEFHHFIEIASCKSKAYIHQGPDCSINEYIEKVSILSKEINNYLDHLKTTYQK